MDSQQDESRKLKCLFIGNLANHSCIGRVAALKAAQFDVSLVNVGRKNFLKDTYPVPEAKIVADWFEEEVDPHYRRITKRHRGLHLRRCLMEYLRIIRLIPEENQLRERVRQLFLSLQPDFVVVHYGTDAIHYARVINRVMPQVPVIDILNLLPSNLAKGLGKKINILLFIEMTSYRYWLGKIDGVVYASKEMEDYARRAFAASGLNSLILPDYLPKSFQASCNSRIERHVEFDNNPSVIFLGAPERWGGQLDDVDEEFMRLANERIHIFSSTISDEVIATGFGHRYPRLGDEDVFAGKLSEFAMNFDAAIITYNNLIQGEERFRSTLPTRFFMALAAAIPIAVREGFESCERFVAENAIGFSFRSAADLRSKLLDRKMISKLRNKASDMRKHMNGEAQAEDIRGFVREIIGR